MTSSKDGVIWMTSFLLIVSHISLIHVGLRQELVTPEWIGYVITQLAGIGGYIVLIIFMTGFFTVLGYLFLRNHKIKIMSLYLLILAVTLFYNLHLVFN